MKTICMLLLIGFCHGLAAQNLLDPAAKAGSVTNCSLSYTGGSWAITHSDTARHQCRVIEIASVPAVSQASTAMNLFINQRGTYYLQKSASLQLLPEHDLVVEDLLTGQYYNLKSAEPYIFNQNRGFQQTRFVLGITKKAASGATAAK